MLVEKCYNTFNYLHSEVVAMVDTRSISLFSGAMGLDLGLMEAGIKIEVGQDLMPAVSKL